RPTEPSDIGCPRGLAGGVNGRSGFSRLSDLPWEVACADAPGALRRTCRIHSGIQAGRQAGQQLPTLAGTHALQKPPKLDDLLAAPLCVAESHALPPRSRGRRGAGACCPVPCYLTSAVPLDIDGRLDRRVT